MLAVQGPRHSCWLLDSAADVHVCNDIRLLSHYQERATIVGGSTADGVSPGRGKIRLHLALEDGSEGVALTVNNVLYMPNSPCNLVSLGRMNNSGIFYNNENKTLYDVKTRRTLAHAQRWRNSYLLKPLNLSDSAVFLTRIDDETYQYPPSTYVTTSNEKLLLSTWHKRLGHLNFLSLKQHLKKLGTDYTDDSNGYTCDSCQRAKATKDYNRRVPQRRAQYPYQFIHTDLVGPISPTGFGGERYFFTFTDDFSRYTEAYTGTKKSDWFKCLKAFYNLCKTRSKQERPVERLRSDYGSELQSKKVGEWLTNEGIIFEPSAPYSQEQNGVSERGGRTIMDMTRATILEGNINDDLWPEVVLAMTHVKNIRLRP